MAVDGLRGTSYGLRRFRGPTPSFRPAAWSVNPAAGRGPTMAKASQEEMVAMLQAYQDKLAQAEQEGKARFEQVFASPPPGVAVHEFDTSATIRRVNAEELKILGYESSQVVGRA